MRLIEERLGVDIVEAIEDAYHRQGKTLKQISHEWGIGLSTLSLWMQSLGIEARVFDTRRLRLNSPAA